MSRMITIMLTALMVVAFTSVSFAGLYDQKCAACHKAGGKKGLSKMSKDDLLKKYKAADEFIKGAKDVKNPLMKPVQGDEKLLKDAAADLGLK